jgi:hypothetical protein
MFFHVGICNIKETNAYQQTIMQSSSSRTVDYHNIIPGDHLFVGNQHGIYLGYCGATHWICTLTETNQVSQISVQQFAKCGSTEHIPLNKAEYGQVEHFPYTFRSNSIRYQQESNDVQTIVQRTLEQVDMERNPWITNSEELAYFCKTGQLLVKQRFSWKKLLLLIGLCVFFGCTMKVSSIPLVLCCLLFVFIMIIIMRRL